MKILLTGAAGYIGSILVPELLRHGHEVIAIDNFMYNQTSLLECCADRKFTLIRGDVRNRTLISECLKSVDAILPLACLTGAPICEEKPSEAKAINYDAVKIILELK